MEYTTVVAAGASDPANAVYIRLPAAMGEYFHTGEDALIIYDDLTKQAWAYRQISLLLKDRRAERLTPEMFSTYTAASERAARVNADYVEQQTNGAVKGKTGSLTALPIIETQAGRYVSLVLRM